MGKIARRTTLPALIADYLPRDASVTFEVLDPEHRPVSATADTPEARALARVSVHENRDVALEMLFDREHGLEERILKEQFIP